MSLAQMVCGMWLAKSMHYSRKVCKSQHWRGRVCRARSQVADKHGYRMKSRVFFMKCNAILNQRCFIDLRGEIGAWNWAHSSWHPCKSNAVVKCQCRLLPKAPLYGAGERSGCTWILGNSCKSYMLDDGITLKVLQSTREEGGTGNQPTIDRLEDPKTHRSPLELGENATPSS